MKNVSKLVVAITLLLAGSQASYAAGQKLSPELAQVVNQVVQACILGNAVSAHATINPACSSSRNSALQLSLRDSGVPGSNNGEVYNGVIETNGGAALGGITLRIELQVGGGMDADENSIDFYDAQSNLVGSYDRTDDGINNGLALLKAVKY